MRQGLERKFVLKYIICVMACVVLAFGCGSRRHDSRLEHVADIVSESPREALAVLDSIDCNSLSKADRHYYDRYRRLMRPIQN